MRKRMTVILTVVFLLLPLCALLWANQSKHFIAKEIVITGNSDIAASEIVKRSGIWVGNTSMLFSASEAEKKIMENPWVEKVSVEKLPYGKIRIKISESEPFCVVAPENKKPYYVNAKGKKLGHVEASRGLDFPVISGEGEISMDILLQAIEILNLSKSSSVLGWSEISQIVAGDSHGVKLLTVDRRFVNFGKDNMASKWRKVERIIAHTRKENLVEEYIDISSGEIGVISYDS